MSDIEKIKIVKINNLYNDKGLGSFIEELDLDNTFEEVKTKIFNGLSDFKVAGVSFLETLGSFIVV